MSESIAVVGLGAMGAGAARRLLPGLREHMGNAAPQRGPADKT